MRLYAGTADQFWQDNVQNQIADKLKNTFFSYYRYNPSPNEVGAWKNSLRAVSMVFKDARLTDHGVILEYQMPLTSKRLDCMVCGDDVSGAARAVIVELKQWETCERSTGEREVRSFVGGAERDLPHPSVQVNQYQRYLQDTHTAFYDEPDPISLQSCSYLHNYSFVKQDPLLDSKFEAVLRESPLFSKDDSEPLKDFLRFRLDQGNGQRVLNKILNGVCRPSKKLMDHVAGVIKGKSQYVLLDEQLVVYDMVFATVKCGFHDRRKSVLIVRGGPGTGKSVIAINLMADLLRQGYNAHYATGSKSFTETLRKVIGPRGSAQFKYFNSYTDAAPDDIDVLILDEAHRIRETSNNRFTPRVKRSKLSQIEELMEAGKVIVAFIDDDQVVRPNEIGSSAFIREKAGQGRAEVREFELPIQFRCSGSDAFVNWVNNTLGIKRTANVLWNRTEPFDFRIVDSPHELERLIREKAKEGHTARLAAGYCWPWSDPAPDGKLADDVVIGDFRRPWNAKPEASRLAPGIPKSHLWAYDPGGIDQVGCIYTAQGFEFDYAGVIFGNDLRYNPRMSCWEGFAKESYDTVVKRSKDKFLDLVKNTYRVLLSRAIKGCYVYFMDEDTKNFVKSRIE